MTAEQPAKTGQPPTDSHTSLLELARVFLKLGCIGFGGPAAHIAMLEEEVVERRKWIVRQHYLDLIGATNLIPGPNSTEMTMHVGYERRGWLGLFVAGTCFIGPAVLLSALAAWAYVAYGTLPAVEPFLIGIKPAVVAVILGAVWRLGRKAAHGWRLFVLGLTVTVAVLAGVGEVLALLVGGGAGMLWLHMSKPSGGSGHGVSAALVIPALSNQTGAAVLAGASGAAAVSLWQMGLFFLKIGAVLYGSGYVLVAFLQGGLVEQWEWITQAQLLDAIAIGQFTPGPVLSTATFVGFVIDGPAGAAVATLGIFLPSFLFVLILNPIIPRLRESPLMSCFLDAVNVSAIGLMLAVTIELGARSLATWETALITGVAALLALRFRLNAAWIVLGGAAMGAALGLLPS